MKHLLTLFICLCLFQSANAQKDFREAYVITNDGDTVNGWIDYRKGTKYAETCDFKESENQEVTSFSPEQLKGFRFIDDKYFVSNHIVTAEGSSEKVFMEVLVSGVLTLFRFQESFFINKNDTIIHQLLNEDIEKNEDGKKFRKSSNKYIGLLTYLMFDCADLRSEIKKLYLNEKELTRLVERYNKCIGNPGITYKEKKPWLSPTVGISTGIHSSKMKTHQILSGSHLKPGFERENSFIAGVNLELSAPRLNENISFYSGLFYLKTQYLSYSTIQHPYYIERNDVTVDISQIKIPVGIKYQLPGKSIKPYISLGFSKTFHLSATTLWIQELEKKEVITTTEGEAFPITKHQSGIWGSIGIRRKTAHKFSTHMEIRYEHANGVMPNLSSSSFPSHISNISLLIGFSL